MSSKHSCFHIYLLVSLLVLATGVPSNLVVAWTQSEALGAAFTIGRMTLVLDLRVLGIAVTTWLAAARTI